MGAYTAGTSINILLNDQLTGTSGSPRTTYNAPTTVFQTPDGRTVPAWTDYPVTVSP